MFRRTGFLRTLVPALFLLIVLFAAKGEAAYVERVKGKQVVINNEDTDVKVGEKYFVVINGKRRAVVQITRVRGKKSVGVITKGKAAPDASLEPVRKSRSSVADDESVRKPRKRRTRSAYDSDIVAISPTIIGGLIGYAMDSQTVTVNNRSVPMSGSGFSAKAFTDMPLSGRLGFIARGGIEQLELSGDGERTSIMYLTADALLRYAFSEGTFVPFAAGGLGIHYPLSKSSTILDETKIAMTSVFFASVGMNYKWMDGMYATAHVEYSLFPPSSSVNTNVISLRGGFGWQF